MLKTFLFRICSGIYHSSLTTSAVHFTIPFHTCTFFELSSLFFLISCVHISFILFFGCFEALDNYLIFRWHIKHRYAHLISDLFDQSHLSTRLVPFNFFFLIQIYYPNPHFVYFVFKLKRVKMSFRGKVSILIDEKIAILSNIL